MRLVRTSSPYFMLMFENLLLLSGVFLRNAVTMATRKDSSVPSFSKAVETSAMHLSRWRHSLPVKAPALSGSKCFLINSSSCNFSARADECSPSRLLTFSFATTKAWPAKAICFSASFVATSFCMRRSLADTTLSVVVACATLAAAFSSGKASNLASASLSVSAREASRPVKTSMTCPTIWIWKSWRSAAVLRRLWGNIAAIMT
mmetsp:Transcript_94366/g.250645  ORF Transcript_94366/g.250645 Transcript_94366/m.250645 type:complete len:204 (-) Transcript_94366:268-879(-)